MCSRVESRKGSVEKVKRAISVLYLAEVVQRKSGMLGGGKSELKLLACQRNEQSWSAVSGEEVVAADEASRYSSGALLLVDLTASKQVQRIQEAGRPLVSILQNFSRLQEKFKTQEEEIEQWKQSLTYQSQELNRREMEMEARREQLEQLESDFEQLEQQKQEFAGTRSEIDGLKTELERRQQELEGAWDHLRGERRQLEEAQSEMAGNSVLDEGRAAKIQGLLSHLSGAVPVFEHYESQVQRTADLVNHKQDLLTQHWQHLEQYRAELTQQQVELEQCSQAQAQRWQEWQAAACVLEQTKATLQIHAAALQTKQEYVQQLGLQTQNFEGLQHQLQLATEGEEGVAVSAAVDMQALEQMSTEQLERTVNNLQNDLDKSLTFVHSQEEELELKQTEIDGLEGKLSQVSEFDRMSLESELTDEKDAYQFLNETLLGQRRNLREKEGILRQHKLMLNRRQGRTQAPKEDGMVDFAPLIQQLSQLNRQNSDRLQQVEADIAQVQAAIEQTRGTVDQQSQDVQAKRNELDELEYNLKEQRVTLGEMQGKVRLYEEMLQPIQDSVDSLKQSIGEVANQVSQLQSSGAEQQSALGQMHEVINGLMPQPQLAAS
jgi:chromosome segregation ATPase